MKNVVLNYDNKDFIDNKFKIRNIIKQFNIGLTKFEQKKSEQSNFDFEIFY